MVLYNKYKWQGAKQETNPEVNNWCDQWQFINIQEQTGWTSSKGDCHLNLVRISVLLDGGITSQDNRWRLIGPKVLPGPMQSLLIYCFWTTLREIRITGKYICSRKRLCKCHLQNVSRFVRNSLCQRVNNDNVILTTTTHNRDDVYRGWTFMVARECNNLIFTNLIFTILWNAVLNYFLIPLQSIISMLRINKPVWSNQCFVSKWMKHDSWFFGAFIKPTR